MDERGSAEAFGVDAVHGCETMMYSLAIETLISVTKDLPR